MLGLTLLQTGCIQAYHERFKQTTVSGLTCQKWNSQTPHSHSVGGLLIGLGQNAHFSSAIFYWGANFDHEKDKYGEKDFETNFCRNPDNEPGGSWCYTTDPDSRWEYCGIPNCEETTATITSVLKKLVKVASESEQHSRGFRVPRASGEQEIQDFVLRERAPIVLN